MSNKLRLVVIGIMGCTPFAGVAWQVLHYLEGFRRLGHDVFYIEDTGAWPYDPEQGSITDDCRYTVNYIARLMDWCGLTDRWAYRFGIDGRTFGLSDSQVLRLFERADALVNLCGAAVLRDEHLRVPIRIYLETDPVLPQIQVAKGVKRTIDWLSAHTHHFTFGENIGTRDCLVPAERFEYHPTRQPIVLDWWKPNEPSPLLPKTGRFTTVSSWQQSGKDIEWNGDTYLWSKHIEFLKFIDLPRLAPQQIELALACKDPEVIKLLTSKGWRVVDAIALSTDISPYHDYILASRGEFTVAKDQYVRPHSGWFSDRSACYLAAGRPVITQNTGFGKVLPTGEGLFCFNTMEDIVTAFDNINTNYEKNCRKAKEIAEGYFGYDKVLRNLLKTAGLL